MAGWTVRPLDPAAVPAASRQYLRFQVTAPAEIGFELYEPVGVPIGFAFTLLDEAPSSGYVSGAWEEPAMGFDWAGEAVATCLVGPGGAVQLVPGTYYVWVQLTPPGSQEQPVLPAGQVQVY